MAEAILYDTVGRLLGDLAQSAAGEITSYFGGTQKVRELENTMLMIQARLHDTETSREGERGETIRLLLKQLKNVLYRLDDLLDEVPISTRPDEHMATTKFKKLVCCLVAKFDHLKMSKKLNKGGQEIIKEFEKISSKMDGLGLVRVHSGERPTFNLVNDRETSSYISNDEMVGRDEDKKRIMQMLIGPEHADENLSVIPIVGMGGSGKTALAQFVYNDTQVQQHFERKYWACISVMSNRNDLVKKVLKSITSYDNNYQTLENIETEIQEVVKDKKYLLVLDDVWDDTHRENWLHLHRLLKICKKGSKIIVTTRSEEVASNMGTVGLHKLKDLSPDHSWTLFKKLAFREGQQEQDSEFSNIGREIVKKCANVPLVIRAIAGLLHSKDTKEEWELFRDTEISKIKQGEDNVLSTLRLSYQHLKPHLKRCFGYCSLFPKDYKFNLIRLISSWMSQGFIQLDTNPSPYVVGYGYFMELLRRNFFLGEIYGCKMHDLMHDLACEVMEGECGLYNKPMDNFDDNIRHMHFNMAPNFEWGFNVPQHIRSLFLSSEDELEIDLDRRFTGGRGLRALCIDYYIKCEIPKCIGELKHLRYLRINVSCGYLPNGITRLQKLQTLELDGCIKLIELPRDFCNLTSLRHLHIQRSTLLLNDMPHRFEELRLLERLNKFLVGDNNGLDALGNMNLVGGLEVEYRKRRPNAILEARKANIKLKKLSELLLKWEYLDEEEAEADEVIKCLEPPSTLKLLKIEGWKGVRFPRWGKNDLPSLVRLEILYCKRCQYLPVLSELPYLKELELIELDALEYVEEGEGESGEPTSTTSASTSWWNSL